MDTRWDTEDVRPHRDAATAASDSRLGSGPGSTRALDLGQRRIKDLDGKTCLCLREDQRRREEDRPTERTDEQALWRATAATALSTPLSGGKLSCRGASRTSRLP